MALTLESVLNRVVIATESDFVWAGSGSDIVGYVHWKISLEHISAVL